MSSLRAFWTLISYTNWVIKVSVPINIIIITNLLLPEPFQKAESIKGQAHKGQQVCMQTGSTAEA
jgi:hypothetical protein